MPHNPHADFDPVLKPYTGQGAFRFWCQLALPLTFDDSLSYYELLNKVVVYLNNTIQDVANAEENIESLNTAYNQLQNYVNEYFDSLDLQAEIDRKLDEMALDGTLTDLINPLIPDAVTEWLNEHITYPEPGEAVIVDNTLSVSGAAADAKVTGDNINNLKEQIFKAFYLGVENANCTPLNSNDDLDSILTVGTYKVTTNDIAETIVHYPPDVVKTSFKMVVLATSQQGRYWQIMFRNNANINLFCRYYNGSVWGDWYALSTKQWAAENMLMFTESQALTEPQKTTARNNIDVLSKTEIVKQIKDNTGAEYVDGWVIGRRISTASPVSFTPTATTYDYACLVADCTPGEQFTLTGKNASTAYALYCWCQADGTVVDKPTTTLNYTDVVITAPENAAKLVINVADTTIPYYLFRGLTTKASTAKSLNNAEKYADNLNANIMPTLSEGWFDWKLHFSYIASGGTNSADGFATTAPISVMPGMQIINTSPATDDNEIALGFYVITFTNDTFQKRTLLNSGDVFTVPADVNFVRLMFGYGSSASISITKPILSRYFSVRMLTAARQNAMEIPVYVAYGASTTIGAVHRFTGQGTYYSAYSFPDYMARALNVKSYNHAHGTTGFIARDGGPNFMDCILADGDLLETASFVSIIFGYGNDHSARLPIGVYTDYYPFDEEGYNIPGTEGVQQMIAKGATLMGCLNWCIKYISEKYPKITLAVIAGSPSENHNLTITQNTNPESTGNNGIPPYKLTFADPFSETGIVNPGDEYNLPTGNQGVAQIKTELPKLKKALNIPIINMYEEGNNINYYNASVREDGNSGKWAIFSTVGTESDPSTWTWNSHPNDDGYKMYARYLAGRLAGIFNH